MLLAEMEKDNEIEIDTGQCIPKEKSNNVITTAAAAAAGSCFQPLNFAITSYRYIFQPVGCCKE
jgi:hypothetical protein